VKEVKVAKQNSYTLEDSHVPGTLAPAGFQANAVTRVRLPLSGYITHIDALIRVRGASLVTNVPKEDAFARLIRGIRIKSSGARSFVDFSDGRQWKYYSWLQYRGQLNIDALPNLAAVGNTDYYAQIPIHLGMFPADPFDTSVVVPAVETTDLVMEVTWGDGLDMGGPAPADWVIDQAEMKLLISEIALAPGEKRSLIWKKGLVMPRFEPRIIPLAQAYANLGLVSDLPVGDTLHRTVVMVTDKSTAPADPRGRRTNDFVNEVGVKFPKLREIPWQRDFRQFIYEAQRKYDLVNAVTGISQLDGLQLSGRAIGLDLTRAVTGDAQLAFSNTLATVTSGDIQLLHYLMS
jgi:hypothetical protein